MIPLFLGLTLANLIMLTAVFVFGVQASGAEKGASEYTWHISFAIVSGLLTVLVHCAVYTYFMATTKWLAAATDKGGLNAKEFIEVPAQRKRNTFFIAMAAIGITMVTMFGGAAADTIPWWPANLHLGLGISTLAANLFCAALEFRQIRAQGLTMDSALELINSNPGVRIATVKEQYSETIA